MSTTKLIYIAIFTFLNSSIYADEVIDLGAYSREKLVINGPAIIEYIDSAPSDSTKLAESLIILLTGFNFADGAEVVGTGETIIEAWNKHPEVLLSWFANSREQTKRLIDVLSAIYLDSSSGQGLLKQFSKTLKASLNLHAEKNYHKEKTLLKLSESVEVTMNLQ